MAGNGRGLGSHASQALRFWHLKDQAKSADEGTVGGYYNRRSWIVCALVAIPALMAGCEPGSASWPPPPKSDFEKSLIAAARVAVKRYDGWTDIACVVERGSGRGEWQVQAWKIVNPKATGRNQCVPWAVRAVILDDKAEVTGYRNHL